MTAAVGIAQSGVNNVSWRNRIINGGMVVDQRNAGASVTLSGGQYLLDRWRSYTSQASKLSAQQSTTAPTGFTNSMLFTSLSAFTPAATDEFFVDQRIEGVNVADLAWGTASAQSITVSFWVRSSLTGTFSGAIVNSSGNRNYPFTFTISAANTFEYKTVTIPGDTTGTWLTNTGIGLQLKINLGTGSTYLQPAGAWTSSYANGASGSVALVATNGATFYITGVQLERGTTATPFEYRDYGRELMMCQRYYYKSPQTANGEGFITYQAIGGWTGTTCFPVTMRATPTMTYGYSTPYSGNTFNRVDTGGTITVTLSQNLVSVSRVMSIYDGGQAGIPLGTNFSTYLTASAEL